jgi:uncharacterized protein
MKLRVIVDTSTLVGAALRPDSVPDRALTLALSEYELLGFPDLLRELSEVLRRKRFDTYVSLQSRMLIVEVVQNRARHYFLSQTELSEVRGCCRDANDEWLLALALTANADIVVSSDRDLLALHPWRGIAILTPAQFLEQFPV